MKRNDLKEYFLCLLFPNHCRFCGELTESGKDICDECEEKLPVIEGEICYNCGSAKADCKCKGRHGKYYDRIASAFYYEEPVKHCIAEFKFNGDRSSYKVLAELMAESCKQRYDGIKFDYITYVPMDKRKERARGFNQSKLLAKEISEELDIPFGDKLLVKLYETDNQHDCGNIERTGNLLGAFDINSDYDVSGKTVLLIDDIKTSGSTLSECGKMLYLYGAERVFCLTAALRKSTIKEDEKQEKEADDNARREDSF